MKKQIFFCFALISWTLGAGQTLQQAGINPFDYKIEKKLIASKGAVASAHPLASLVGASMLKQGGNAFDAAIATQLALAVVYPNAGNLGGGGFLVGQLSNGKQVAIDYREKAPAAAHRDLYIEPKPFFPDEHLIFLKYAPSYLHNQSMPQNLIDTFLLLLLRF